MEYRASVTCEMVKVPSVFVLIVLIKPVESSRPWCKRREIGCRTGEPSSSIRRPFKSVADASQSTHSGSPDVPTSSVILPDQDRCSHYRKRRQQGCAAGRNTSKFEFSNGAIFDVCGIGNRKGGGILQMVRTNRQKRKLNIGPRHVPGSVHSSGDLHGSAVWNAEIGAGRLPIFVHDNRRSITQSEHSGKVSTHDFTGCGYGWTLLDTNVVFPRTESKQPEVSTIVGSR